MLAGCDVPKYPSVPNDWYHGPIHPTHVPHRKEMDIALSHEEPKLIKVGMDLSQEKDGGLQAIALRVSWCNSLEVFWFEGDSTSYYPIYYPVQAKSKAHSTKLEKNESKDAAYG